MDGFGKKVISTAAKIGAALGGIAFFKQGVGLAAQLQQDEIAIKSFTGSLESANNLIGDIRKFAASTPFQLNDLIGASKQLLAFGVSADQVTNRLFVLGNLAAASGANIGDLALIFGKIKSQGKVMGETLNQLAERGVPIISALADHFKVPEEAIREMVSKGKVSFNDFEAAMNSLGGEGGKFGNLMSEQADTLSGKWSTFKDKVNDLAINIGQALLPIMTELLNLGFVMVEWVQGLDMQTVKLTASILAGVAAFALVIKWGGKLVKVIRTAITIYRSLASAQAVALAFSGVGIPVLLAAGAAATAAVIGINMFFNSIESSADSAVAKTEALTNSTDKVAAAAQKTETIGDVAEKNTKKLEQENKELDKMAERLDIIANRASVGVAVRGTVAAAQARSEAIKSLEKHQVAQLKAQQKANDHLAKIEANTKDNIAIAGI
jgi:tape measure domain-containing protein